MSKLCRVNVYLLIFFSKVFMHEKEARGNGMQNDDNFIIILSTKSNRI